MNTLEAFEVGYRKPETEGAYVSFAPSNEHDNDEDIMRQTTPTEDANQESEEYLLTHAFA